MITIKAGRTVTKVNYEFLDGSTSELTIQSASTKEIDSVVDNKTTESGTTVNEKTIRLLLCKTDPVIVDKVYKEQYEEDHIGDFVNLLFQIIHKEKEGKLNDLLNG